MWIAAAEFNELLGDLDRREAVRTRELRYREDAQPVAYLACPRCSETMARRNFGRTSGIMVDTCKRHGIWLDRGELRQVVDYLAQRATDPSVPAPARPRTPASPAHAPAPQRTFIDALLDILTTPFT